MSAHQSNSVEKEPHVPESAGWKPTPAVPPPGASPQDQSQQQAKTSPFASAKAAYVAFLDKRIPSHRRYLGMKRRVFLLVLLGVLLCLLALIIGLAVGLSKKSNRFLPLPSDKQSFTGDLTYYGPGLGACGVTSTETDDIVSLSHYLFDHEQTGSDPNQNPLCGRMIRAVRYYEERGEQRSVDLRVVDRCTGCEPTDIDVSPGVFEKLANVDRGRVTVTWAWLSPDP